MRDYDVRGRVISEQDTSVAEDQSEAPVYSYTLIPDGSGNPQGYEANGNVLGYNDSVMGQWSFSYDQLNRLTGATAGEGHYQGLNITWDIDPFGNRKSEVYSGNPTAPLTAPVEWVNYNANNRVLNSSQVPAGYQHDLAGDVTFDGANTYTYDAEGRVSTACAGQMCTKYVYDAEGRRVAKGSYDAQSGAFAASEQYILGLGGEEVTALDGSGQWLRTNAYLGGALLATYKDAALYFQFTDWLGTKRVQLANDGTQPEICRSLPYGNQLDCSGAPEVDPHHFTGKQRDPETGLDYFGARYYDPQIGRFISEDPIRFKGSGTNFYAYVRNNPILFTDSFGLCVDQKLSNCISKLFGVTAMSLTPSEPGQGGSFTGSMQGIYNGFGQPRLPGPYVFTVKNDVTVPVASLTVLEAGLNHHGLDPLTKVFGLTISDNPFITFTGADLDVSSMQQNQIWELGNALGMITGNIPQNMNMNYGPGNTEPGQALQDCLAQP